MHAKVNDWGAGVVAVELELSSDEIEPLIRNLRSIQSDHDQHFHLSQDGEGRLGDIEIAIQPRERPHNLRLMSLAIPPGSEIPSPGVTRPRSGWIRPVAAALMG